MLCDAVSLWVQWCERGERVVVCVSSEGEGVCYGL